MDQNFQIQYGRDEEGKFLEIDEKRHKIDDSQAFPIVILHEKRAMTITLDFGAHYYAANTDSQMSDEVETEHKLLINGIDFIWLIDEKNKNTFTQEQRCH